MSENKFLQKAAQQALSESLGYEEALAYYLILTKNQKQLKQEFSYSKKYRILKSLFNSGALAKLKTEDKDIYSYVLLPPSFLYLQNTDEKLIEHLEKIFIKNYMHILETNFSQLILRDERPLVIFMLKYVMKESASLSVSEIDYKSIGIQTKNINIKASSERQRKIGIIDNKFAFEFSCIRNKTSYDYVGYIANQQDNVSKDSDYVAMIERELRG